jgi:hypothetical protein
LPLRNDPTQDNVKVRHSGLLNALEVRPHEAEANRLPYAQFPEMLLQDEINIRQALNYLLQGYGLSEFCVEEGNPLPGRVRRFVVSK